MVLLLTFLSLVLGELAPKGIALRNPEALATWVAPFFTVLSKVARSLVWLLDRTASGLLWLLGMRGAAQEVVTEEDVRAAMLQAAESGSLEETESERLASVLRFNDRRVRDLMTPRTEAVTLYFEAPIEMLVETVLANAYDCDAVWDRNGDVVGQVAVTDVLRALYTGEPLADFVRPAVFVPEAAWNARGSSGWLLSWTSTVTSAGCGRSATCWWSGQAWKSRAARTGSCGARTTPLWSTAASPCMSCERPSPSRPAT